MAVPHLHLLLLLHLFITTVSASNVKPGSSLYASNLEQTWSSSNNTFFLGFSQLGPTTFLSAIFLTGGLPIWTAGVVDYSGVLHFYANGSLHLVNGSGSTVWSSNTANLGVTFASLDDSGNLRLRNDTVSFWSSFDNPTDTIVPSQDFTENQILRSGSYSFKLLSSGNVTLTWNDSVVYWNKRLMISSSDESLISPRLELQSNGILSFSHANMTRAVTVAFGNDYGEGSDDVFRFVRLDSDGNLRMYSSSRGSGSVTSSWALMADTCQVFGYCGNFGVCSYIDSNPVCGCPSQNFEQIDVNNGKKGCKRKMELQDCAGNVTMLELKNTEFLTFQPDQMFIVGITACRSNCLNGGSCVASSSLSDGSGYCYMKTPDFVSGHQSPVVPSTSYVKVCGPAVPNPPVSTRIGGKDKCERSQIWVVGAVISGTLLFFIGLVGGFWWWYRKYRLKVGGTMWTQFTSLEYASGAPVQFSYKELHRSTKGFKEKLGAGGFGVVYRGILADKTVVAMKQLEGIQQGERQFRMEVATISSTHHLNLVRLIGFCSEGRHRLLVYEFMKNGSLDSFLFATEGHSGKLLNWNHRFKIALGTARGIMYLHEECRDCIVHCDIKPENILLDEHYNAKVSDFGLAKLINPKDPRYKSLTNIRGTRGYLAPEWLANLPITSKSDVYSYGMVLLEMVSGRRNFEVSHETNQKKFSSWAYEEFEKGNAEAICDRTLADQYTDMEQVARAIHVSFWCIQEHPSQRPTMSKVVQMLEGIIQIPKPPAPKLINEASVHGRSTIFSSKDSPQSTFEASPPAPSSASSSSQAAVMVLQPTAVRRNMEKPSSSLLEPNHSKS